MKDKRNVIVIALAVLLMGVGLPAVSSAADVSTECAYTDTTFICEIYVDTGGVELRSGGVMMTYDTGKLSAPVATKNETDWYFGAGVAQHDYMNPDTATSGLVVFIVGILNENHPAAGVGGTRVKVGDVSFTREDTVNPPLDTSGADQAVFFGITTDLGRVAPYVNFVDTAGTELDSAPVGFGEMVAERGDANAYGRISTADYIATRNLIGSTNFPPYANCNGDSVISTADYICVRNKI
jgi:hypothetical protein